mgnify:CR=1 FL=1
MNRPTDWIAAALAVVGALFAVLAAVGILRMPDLFTRMHAASKAGSLGACCTVLAAAVHFHQADITVRAVLTVLFVVLTAPIAAHVIGRGGYLAGAKLSPETVVDEFGSRPSGSVACPETADTKPEGGPPPDPCGAADGDRQPNEPGGGQCPYP